MTQEVRVIQAGLGGFGRGWAKIVRDAPGVTLAAVVDPSPVARDWAVAELGIPGEALFASLDDALGQVESDAVVVVTPPDTHHTVVTAALAAGRHVLVEKPLATTIEDALDLVAAAARANRLAVVSQNYRHRPPARAAQQAIAEGAIGDLVSVRIAFRRDTRSLWPPDNFRYIMQHPVVLDMSIHHMDLLRLLTGRNVERLTATSWRAPDSPYVHDPEVVAVMDLGGGVPVVYEGSWAARGGETSWNADWEIVGEHGRLLWTGGQNDALTGNVVIERWGQEPRPVPLPGLPATDRAGALAAFARAVLEGSVPECAAADNVHSLGIVLACVRSIEQTQPVSLSDLFAPMALGALLMTQPHCTSI